MCKKNILVLINGRAGVGKDTFVSYCQEYLNEKNIPSTNRHRSDLPKIALRTMGWDEVKDQPSRAVLKHMVEFAEEKGYLNKYLESALSRYKVVFWHVREPKSMYRYIEKYIDSDKVTPVSLLVMRDTENLEPDEWWDIENADYMIKTKIKNGIEHSKEAARIFIDFILDEDFCVKKAGGTEHE